jgi:hypothetical protein
VPLALIGGLFGLFGSAGLIMWFGSRIGAGQAAVVALGWPALFLSLGFNFVDYAIHPPDVEPLPVWGWLVPGIIFWVMGGAPLVVGLAAWREARAGRQGNRVSRRVVDAIPSGLRRATGRATPPVEETTAFSIPTDPAARRVDAPESLSGPAIDDGTGG